MLQALDDEVDQSAQDTVEAVDDLIDSKDNLQIEIGSVVSNKKRPLEDKTNRTEKKKKKPKLSHPEGKSFQCWQCLNWFEDKEKLGGHSCLTEVSQCIFLIKMEKIIIFHSL